MWDLLPEGLVLVAVMVLVFRPLTIAVATRRSELSGAERAFMAWPPPAYAERRVLFGEDLTFAELTRRFDAGARLAELADDRDGVTPLFVVTGSDLTVVTAGLRPEPAAGDITSGLTATPPESSEVRR